MTELTATLLALFVIVVIPAVIITTHRDINRGLNRAVEIAQHQGWVSPHRLITQAGVKNADAQLILSRACKQGVLFQAVDGRYYLPGGRTKPNAPIAMVGIVPSAIASMLRPIHRPDDSLRISATIVRDTGMMLILDFDTDRSGVYLEKRLMTDPVIDGNRITFGLKIKYLRSNRLHETLNRALAVPSPSN